MLHDIPAAKVKKKVVIIGAGPAGLEAARVAAERGHEVVVFEATAEPGGQLRLASQSPRRREMIPIIDWRIAQCEKRGVEFQFETMAEAEDVIAQNPDVVIVATGGLPHTEVLEAGNELVESTWDIISRSIKPGQDALIYDYAGDHAGLQAAEIIAATGAKVETMTPDRSFAPDVMVMNLVPYMRSMQDKNTTFTVTFWLKSVVKEGDRLIANIGSNCSDRIRQRSFDQIIVNHGTIPLNDIYFGLKPALSNLGAVDQAELIAGKPQSGRPNDVGKFQLFRGADAVSARNTHAAIYNALRLVKNI